jgi:uncharacterized membrane protein
MTITYFSFEGDATAGISPHRPSLEDLGGDDFENAEGIEPTDGPGANAWNEHQRLLVGVAGITPVLAFTLDFAAGAPYIARFWCINSTVEASDLALTDVGAGITEIVYPAGVLPAPVIDPAIFLNGPADAQCCGVTLVEATRTVTATTVTHAGVAADARCTVLVY